MISSAHRAPGLHAERAAILAAQDTGVLIEKLTLYFTLEPCVSLSHVRESCAEVIARVGIAKVFIGRYDPNPLIYREGWRRLRDSGIVLRDFDAYLRAEIESLNNQFVDHFTLGVGPTSGAKFDFLLNDGYFEIQYAEDDERSIRTRWTMAGRKAIHAYAARPLQVGLARFAKRFAEIDDPRAFDFSHSVRAEEGEIAVFLGATGAALVQVIEIHSGPQYGSDHTSVKIQFEVRKWD